jgi:mannitol/fructose-specific phosphotransferase system IIA component (Ntr-type)
MTSTRVERRDRPIAGLRQGSSRLLRPELFFPSVAVTSKEELFALLAGALAEIGVAQHREALVDALLERERLGSTTIGHGVALPHTRSLMVREAALAFARPQPAIDFAARGGEPVRMAFLIVAPYGATGAIYRPLVATLTRLVEDVAIRARLLELESFDQLVAVLQPSLAPLEEKSR